MPGVVRGERSAYHCLKSSKPLTTHARPTASGRLPKPSAAGAVRALRGEWAGPRALRTAPAFRSPLPGTPPSSRRYAPADCRLLPTWAFAEPAVCGRRSLQAGCAQRLGFPVGGRGPAGAQLVALEAQEGRFHTALRYPNSPPSVGPSMGDPLPGTSQNLPQLALIPL